MGKARVSAYQSVASAKEDFNTQVGRMTHCVDTSLPLFLATSIVVQRGHEKVVTVTGIGVMHGQGNVNFHSPRMICLPPLLSRNLPAVGANKVPNMVLFPRVISQLPNSELIMMAHFQHRRGSILFLMEWTLTLDMNLLFLHTITYSKIPLLQNSIHELSECFIYYFGIIHSIAPD